MAASPVSQQAAGFFVLFFGPSATQTAPAAARPTEWTAQRVVLGVGIGQVTQLLQASVLCKKEAGKSPEGQGSLPGGLLVPEGLASRGFKTLPV